MSTPADLETLRTAINDAIDAESWSLAKRKLAQFVLALVTLPDTDIGGARVSYREYNAWAETVKGLIDSQEREARATSRGGIQVTKIRRQRPGSE